MSVGVRTGGLSFNNVPVPVPGFTVLSPTSIQTTVPTRATGGAVAATTSAGTGTSLGSFVVTLTQVSIRRVDPARSPILPLLDGLRHPACVAGMHWSNPPHVIPVIEVIRGERTDPAAVDAVCRLTEAIGMLPVRVQRDVPGFVENRILYAIIREALDLLERGVATAEDIDAVIRWGIGMKLAVIGPLALLDVAGLDIYHSVAGYLNADLSARVDVSPLIRERVERSDLGIKTGRGLVAYAKEQIPALAERRGRLLLQVRKALMG